jgi:manganese transport protein
MKSIWRQQVKSVSMPEAHASVTVPANASFWKKLMLYTGPGLIVAVGYMDPGNWATNIQGGAKFGYTLLSVILISNLFAILLQHLSLKLGIVTGYDLAQACRANYAKSVTIALWLLCEIAIAACDLAELIGAAIALKLLFNIPLLIGILLTVFDVFLLLYFQNKGFRKLEAIVASLITIIFLCFLYEMVIAHPPFAAVMNGFIPSSQIVFNPSMLYIAIGILGATVMPHNLYLHSSIVQTRNYCTSKQEKKEAIKFATIDSTLSLLLAFVINAFILILAASTFHNSPLYQNTADLMDAYHLLPKILGVSLASVFFGIALLASGQNSTLTGTLAGQIVMEGFLDIKLKPWLRRLVTRTVAIIPAIIITIIYGEKGMMDLLVLSQVVLSLQLSFAVFPLVAFTSNQQKMGVFVNKQWLKYAAWTIGIIIAGLNLYLVGTVLG